MDGGWFGKDNMQSVMNLMTQLNISWGDVFTALTSLYIMADLLFKGKRAELKKFAEEKSAELVGSTMNNRQRLNAVVDLLQARFRWLAMIPDDAIINLVNEVYVSRVKPKADVKRGSGNG